jgi:hypothetical protein
MEQARSVQADMDQQNVKVSIFQQPQINVDGKEVYRQREQSVHDGTLIATIEKPENDNTVISLIAMGPSRKHRLAERCIRSIRAGGNFKGYIMLFTDDEGYDTYRYTLSWDPKLILVQGRGEDMYPTAHNSTEVLKPKATSMRYQRFKTLFPKYIPYFPQLRGTKYILYLDIDNVVTQDLSFFFEDYHSKIKLDLQNSTYSSVNDTINRGFISFWRDFTKRKQWQGGQFLVHLDHGKVCLDAWKAEFDQMKQSKDQPLLMNVFQNYDLYKCSIFKLPGGNSREEGKKHFRLFTGEVYTTNRESYPTIVHITGFRTRVHTEVLQRDFLRKALLLENATESMIGNITWEEVIEPVGPKGHRPKKETPSPSDIASKVAPVFKQTQGQNKSMYQMNPNLGLSYNVSALDFVLPTDDNTVIALIAMGRAGSSSYIAERCIRSIRTSGNFSGYVLLFTDEKGHGKKKYTLSRDPKVIVMQGLEEDMEPKNETGAHINYNSRGFMIYKRFKTLIPKYMDYDPRLKDVRYALYLDVDNIVANKLSEFFNDYYEKILWEFAATKAQVNNSDFSFFSLWKDPGVAGVRNNYWQGGQIMYDRYHSTGCADAWRNEMDTVWSAMDQPLLMNVYNNFSRYKCKIFELPDNGKHFKLLSKSILEGKSASFPTLVHITTLRTKKFNDPDQIIFIRDALHLMDDVVQNGTQHIMVENISWNDVAVPVNARGRTPKRKTKKWKKEKKARKEEKARKEKDGVTDSVSEK